MREKLKIKATEPVTIPRWLGLLIVVMAVVTTGNYAWWSTEQQQCNEAFAVHLANRSEWAEQDRRALVKAQQAEQRFWLRVYQHPQDRAQNLVAFQNWVETFQHSNEVFHRNSQRRASVSLPDLAKCE